MRNKVIILSLLLTTSVVVKANFNSTSAVLSSQTDRILRTNSAYDNYIVQTNSPLVFTPFTIKQGSDSRYYNIGSYSGSSAVNSSFSAPASNNYATPFSSIGSRYSSRVASNSFESEIGKRCGSAIGGFPDDNDEPDPDPPTPIADAYHLLVLMLMCYAVFKYRKSEVKYSRL